MGFRRAFLVPLVAAVAASFSGAGEAAVTAPVRTWAPAPAANFQPAHRTAGEITTIVIHVTDGSFDGAVSWLTNDQSHVSAHFAVSRDGEIVQMVHLRDIAWHAGNHAVNAASIGIEHEGVTDDPSGFPDAEYRASAWLVAWLTQAYGIPIDRQHIIGHSDVPDPTDPTQGGGIDHHSDPGRYWDWPKYLRLVREYAFPSSFARLTAVGLRPGQVLRGIVSLRARASAVRRLDFFVDGRLIQREFRAPFGARWNTNRVHNGRHVLVVRAYGRRGRPAVWRIPFVVANHVLAIAVAGVENNGLVDSFVHIRARIGYGRARAVALLVDGRVVARRSHPPFTFAWDGAHAREGFHVIELRARSTDGRSALRTISVFVSHNEAQIVGESLAEGQTVQGAVVWQIQVQGAVRRIDWLIDGKLRWRSTSLPFTFGGAGGTWNAAAESPGPHTLTVRAIRPDGTTAEATISVIAG